MNEYIPCNYKIPSCHLTESVTPLPLLPQQMQHSLKQMSESKRRRKVNLLQRTDQEVALKNNATISVGKASREIQSVFTSKMESKAYCMFIFSSKFLITLIVYFLCEKSSLDYTSCTPLLCLVWHIVVKFCWSAYLTLSNDILFYVSFNKRCS